MKQAAVVLAFLLSACGPGGGTSATSSGASSSAGSSSTSSSSSSCSARNDAGKDCKATCQSGQSAVCRNAKGSAEPSCTCASAK